MSKSKVGFAPDRDDEIALGPDLEGNVVYGDLKVPRPIYAAAKKLVAERAPYIQEADFPVDRTSAARARRVAEIRLIKFAASHAIRRFSDGEIILPEAGDTSSYNFHSSLTEAVRWAALADHLELVEQERREQEEQRAKDEFIQHHQKIVDVLYSLANPPLFSEWVKTAGEGASFEKYLLEHEDAIRTAIAQHRAAEAARARLRAALAEAETVRQRLKSEYNIDVEPLERVEVPEAPPGVAEFVQELQRHLVEH